MTPHSSKPSLVLLLHGIGSTTWLLKPLARRLGDMGYHTKLWSYLTLLGSIQQKGQKLTDEMQRQTDIGAYSRIHVVAHSMGSIVTRCMLVDGVPDLLGRVVMIGPPNRGSRIASRLIRRCRLPVRTLAELQDAPDSFVNSLPASPPSVEIGIVAASRDRMVPHGNTHLEGQTDHITLPGHHTPILWSDQCAKQVGHFLQEGRFYRPAEADAGSPTAPS